MFKEATVLATLVQDYPYKDNRISYDEESPSELRVTYHVSDELTRRTYRVRQELVKRLGSMRIMPLFSGINLNYGHVCGTCRAGDSEENSVVDKDCRVHAIENLYIADSSFMPTSGGTNPSLTIAANAMRVADKISSKLNSLSASNSQ
jgi:choline dehydrogenase-like flavoprotein